MLVNSSIRSTRQVAAGSMMDGHGPVNVSLVNRLMEDLNQKAPSGVFFDPKHLEYQLDGGVCSAHSISLIKDLLSSKEPSLHKRVIKCAQKYRTSSTTLRTHQAALNAISKVEDPPEDFMKAKIEALVALHDLQIDYASADNVFIKNNYYSSSEVDKADFYKAVEKLPEGIFLVRAISKEDNHMGEHYGHSMAFINSSEGQYFFDPSSGCTQIASSEVKKKLYDYVAGQCSTWGLNYPRFYRLKLKENENE